MRFDIYKVHTPTNALFIKLDKVLKFTLKITLTCSYMFQSGVCVLFAVLSALNTVKSTHDIPMTRCHTTA